MTIAPARWHRRQQYHRYARSADHLERLLLDSRGLARWSSTALQYDEPIPPELADAMGRLGQAVTQMRAECKDGNDPSAPVGWSSSVPSWLGGRRGAGRLVRRVPRHRTAYRSQRSAPGIRLRTRRRQSDRAPGGRCRRGGGPPSGPAAAAPARPTRAARARRRAHLAARGRDDGRAGFSARERPAR
ncbi:hypothetical protein NKG94_32360 [Micromonospora sp. M12]